MNRIIAFLKNNKEWMFGGVGTAVVAAVLAWALTSGGQVDVKEVIKGLQAAHYDELRGKDERIRELEKAVKALAEEREKADAPPGIDAALKQLAEGKTEAAESIFQQVLEQKRAGGEAASKDAAAAARHIGALAFLHDTQKALSAYAQAVELDPENADGWNRLGHLRHRVGDLDGAIAAYERVLRLGNVAEERGVIAAAYGNIGTVYQTRGDLAKAEEYYLKALAIEKELGRKEGIANAYGNLGIVYRRRGDLAKAEEYHLKSLALNEELGRKQGMASNYGNLGNVYQARGDLAKAEEYYLKSLSLDEELGRKEGMANQYGNLGTVYFTRGDLAKACEAWAESRRLFEELGAAPEVAKVQALMEKAGCG